MSIESSINLIDELLREQQSLTAVERFSQFHEKGGEPELANQYRDLIPLSKPGVGEQYSFEVDLEACSGCKACVTACHSLNGLDEGESWRDVGTLVSEDEGVATQQTVTTACHHCADPACANGCPTLAYEKEADTGVVRHLDDQCIGCQYCTLTCPYDVPKYNDRLGIVRKCDMCQSRLNEGEAPACVQACPNEAIKIRVVGTEEIIDRNRVNSFLLPGTAPSEITQPSTRFVNLRKTPGAIPEPADKEDLTPAHAHTPLAVMLVLTQAAAGILLFDGLSRFIGMRLSPQPEWHAVLGALLAVGGIIGATSHLGRPLQAWRSFLGWRKSWLSREILIFGPWAGISLVYAASLYFTIPNWIHFGLALGAIGAGLLGVFCSVMVYVFTRRPYWSFPQTSVRFGLTLLGLGCIFVFPLLAAAILATKIGFEIFLAIESFSPFPKSARRLAGPLNRVWRERLLLGFFGVVLLLVSPTIPGLIIVGFGFSFAGEFLARSLYFRAVDHPKMPGGVNPQ